MRETVKDMPSGVDYVGKPKRVANNTLQYERANGAIVWRLHRTDIVVKSPEGIFTLDTGGWRTVTTKDRINTYAPCRVASQSGIWYVSGVPFVDGIRIDADGAPLERAPRPSNAQQKFNRLFEGTRRNHDTRPNHGRPRRTHPSHARA